ncbi:MAG: transposase [Spirochaetales bacterium]
MNRKRDNEQGLYNDYVHILQENEQLKIKNALLKEENKLIAILQIGWVTNFDLPFTNNVSERSLRGVKTKMKVSGQFGSIEFARYYATIKSYIETCYRNGINEHSALVRLCQGNPYSVNEIFSKTP